MSMKVAVYILMSLASVANADQTVKAPSIKVLKAIYQAAKRFDVDAQALLKIAFVESSFHENAQRVNSNGTIDYGMFQVNSIHWTTTCKGFDVFTLKGNALCAAKLIKLASKHAEIDADWLGRYHSKTPSKKHMYVKKLNSLQVAMGE